MFISFILFSSRVKSEVFFELPHRDSLLPKTALVLSGGGARGLAQIGVLQGFQQNGIKFDYLVGTSIGAIVGGLYASGYTPDELESILSSANWKEAAALSNSHIRKQLFIDQKQIYDRSLITLKFNKFNFVVPEAATEGTAFDKFLQELLWYGTYQPVTDFNKLKIPFRAVATDLVSGKSASLNNGNLSKAVRASATIPLRYSPIRMDSMILVDGGILSNLPVKQAMEFKPELVIAVNTTSPIYDANELSSAWAIADQVLSIAMEKFIAENEMNADVVIRPELGNYSNDNFNDINNLVLLGKKSFEKSLNEIRRKITDVIYKKISQIIDDVYLPNEENIFIVKYDGFTELHRNYLEEVFPSIENKKELSKLILYLYMIDEDYYSNFKIHINENTITVYADSFDIISKINCNLPNHISDNLQRLTEKFLNLPAKPDIIEGFKESILRYLHSEGYSFASFKELTNSKGIINIKCNLGRIDSVHFSGNGNLKDFLIMRELEFAVGDTATAKDLLQSIDNLNGTLLFENVEIIPEINSENGININVRTEPAPDQTLRLGGRIDNERNAQAGVDFVQENFNNYGARITLRGVFSSSYFQTSLNLENTRIFKSKFSSGLNLYYVNRDMYEYTIDETRFGKRFGNTREFNIFSERAGVKSLFGTQLEKNGRLFLELRHEFQRYYIGQENTMQGFNRLTTAKFGTLFDSRNRPYFATNGRLIEISLESSIIQDGDNPGFSKAKFQYLSHFNIGNLTITPSLLFGMADITTPFLEFFTLGSEWSFFGMREEEHRGRQIFSGSMSYLYKLPFDFYFDTYLYGRYDIGAVWLNPDDIKLAGLMHGAGSGLAFDTPLGPARFSLGKSFYFTQNPNDIKFGPTEFYFVIGINLL
ncbi:MAG: patatin-like phospholipase family protein [Candidatus Kapabacteria bacterium]|nr:patatin-like phospholipase family protein [Ignavibacteriota bacterium]MCW5884456.1 patatin-like phospholipase family protein [Candidatus Kapabacteria bacterium]